MVRKIAKQKYNPCATTVDAWAIAHIWLAIPSSKCDQLGNSLLRSMGKTVTILAHNSIAVLLITKMREPLRHRPAKDVRWVIKGVIIVVGAFTFGAGMRLVAANLGAYAAPAGLIGGALASAVVDGLATAAHSNREKREIADRHLNMIQAHHAKNPAVNETGDRLPLQDIYNKAELDLVQQIEGEHLQPSIPVKAIFSVVLSIGEYAIALWMVEQAAVLAGVPFLIRAIAASIPVVLTHGAAAVQGHLFGVPDHYESLIQEYSNYLTPHPAMTSDEVDFLWLEKEYTEGCIESRVHNILSRHRAQPTPILAELVFEKSFFRQGIQQLRGQQQEAEIQHQQQLEAEIKDVPNRISKPKVDIEGLNDDEIAIAQAKAHQEWLRQVAEAIEGVKEEGKTQLQNLQASYAIAIDAWQALFEEASEDYAEQMQRWQQDQAIDVEAHEEKEVPPLTYLNHI